MKVDPLTPSASDRGITSSDPLLLARGLARAAMDMSTNMEQQAQLVVALTAAQALVGATNCSFWSVGTTDATCQLAIGAEAEAIRGTTLSVGALRDGAEGDGNSQVMTAPIDTGGSTIGFLHASRDPRTAPLAFTKENRDVLALLADCTASALSTAARIKADDRTSDIRLVQELSREIGSSLDLDRVLQTVVNIAARALPFDRGALALYEGGSCDIRAVAGASTVDASAEENQDLAFRAAWAAGAGETFYVGDRESPTTDTERIFLQFFEQDLEKADARSGIYIPLRDDEGVVGILLFEARVPDFASERQRDIATILANQATVAIRNAKLYSQVPLAEALGAFSAKRAKFLAIPSRRRAFATMIGLGIIAAVTLIRWPLRVMAESPVFRATMYVDVRPQLSGTVDQVLVREGSAVQAGEPLARLRDIEARAARASAAAALRSATRSAAFASSKGDAVEQRLQGMREAAAQAELTLRDEELETLTLRAPTAGVVLTSRPELLLDSRLQSGALFITLGRTDSLELEFTVAQRDIGRVERGDEVRIRTDALPQRTFSGRVTLVGAMPQPTPPSALSVSAAPGSLDDVFYPVRAIVSNTDGVLKSGMSAYARVLTAPESLASRLLRTPIRVMRLFWWRVWSWV